MPVRVRTLLLVLGVVAGVATGAIPAHAGTYTVYSCRLPDGSAARTDGWKFTPLFPSVDHSGSTCPGGALWMQMDPNVTHAKDDVIRAYFTAATDTTIVGYKLWRSAQVGSGSMYFVTALEKRGSTETWVGPSCRGDSCTALGDPKAGTGDKNLYQGSPSTGADAVGMYLSCGYSAASDPDCPGANPAGVVAIYASQMTISDGYSPKLPVQPTGSLLDSTHPLSGVQSVGVLATDRGGGVANAAVTIDGNTVAQQVLDDNDGACAQPFQSPAPCPTSASGTIPVDTSKVPDGSHSVQVVITDAAGNTVGSTPVTITTHNAPPDPSCVPDPLAVGSGGIGGWLDQEVVKRRRGHKAVTTTKPVSNLTLPLGGAPVFHAVLSNPDGTPMANASVCIAAQNQGAEDAQPTPIAKVATDGAGNVTLPLDAGPSRTVWAIHRVGNAALATSVQVNVQPRVHVKPKRRHLRNGGVLQVRGLVVGDPVPPAGVLLEIQARVGGHWQTFRTATTDATGAWKTHYRFRRTAGLQRYVLRARVPRQSGYPYATGASKDFAVLVRG